MQWTPDRNGGFSRSDFAQLYLPPLMDPVYGFEAINVESQRRNTSSFLHWLKRMLEVRKQHHVFGHGSFEVQEARNPAVLAFVRRLGDDIVLCVNNLAKTAQPVELHLAEFNGRTPLELLGKVTFPPIGELPYFVTLAPYGFFWFQLT
jgi:maltose alpha-D-glucosyltransferase/alpha-amylase